MTAASEIELYFERQNASLCLQHAVNCLLQGPYFTAVDLAQIAREFDAIETSVMAEGGLDTHDYLKFMSEDSGNVAEDGNYSVQVLQKALEVWNVRLERSTTADGRRLLGAASSQTGFVCNLAQHWLTIRSFRAPPPSSSSSSSSSSLLWFNFNSLLAKPQHLSEFYLDTFLHSLAARGYDIFVVVGELPPLSAASRSLEGSGEWFRVTLQPTVLVHGASNDGAAAATAATRSTAAAAAAATDGARRRKAPETPDDDAAAAAAADDDDDDENNAALKLAIASSLAAHDSEENVDAELDAAVLASLQPNASPAARRRRVDAEPPVDATDKSDTNDNDDDDDELRRAIALSTQLASNDS